MVRKQTPAERASDRKGQTKVASIPWGKRGNGRPRVYRPLLRSLRQTLGLTQNDVAKGAKVSNFVVHEAELGKEVTLRTALSLARYFGKSIEELWGILKRTKKGQ